MIFQTGQVVSGGTAELSRAHLQLAAVGAQLELYVGLVRAALRGEAAEAARPLLLLPELAAGGPQLRQLPVPPHPVRSTQPPLRPRQQTGLLPAPGPASPLPYSGPPTVSASPGPASSLPYSGPPTVSASPGPDRTPAGTGPGVTPAPTQGLPRCRSALACRRTSMMARNWRRSLVSS